MSRQTNLVRQMARTNVIRAPHEYTRQVRAERKSAHDTSVGPQVLGPDESADDASKVPMVIFTRWQTTAATNNAID